MISFRVAILYCVLCLFVLGSCSDKDADPLPQPEPPTPIEGKDFAAGWSAKRISDTSVWDIKFINANTGFCVGDGVFKTVDAGNTWTRLRAPQIPKGKLLEYCSFIDDNTGWVTDRTSLFKTTDGGQSLTVCFMPSKESEKIILGPVQFISSQIGFVTSSHGLYKTVDGGTTWIKIFNDVCSAIFIIDEHTFWVGGKNAIWYTTDGSSFTKKNIGILIIRIRFFDKMNGLALDTHGSVFKTVDGGLTWTSYLRVELGIQTNDMHFFDPENGYVTDLSGIVQFKGKEKVRVVNANDAMPFEVFFTDPDHGYAVSWAGFIYRYIGTQ